MVVGASILAINLPNQSLLLSQAAECNYHHGYHYLAKEATIDEAGHKEFWACCECGHQYLSLPNGEFITQSDEYMTGDIDENHIAYIAPLTRGGNSGDYWVIDSFDDEFTPQPTTKIFVMAGQSNAAGVGHYEYLEEVVDDNKILEINNGYSNVLMTGYSHSYMDDYRPVYADENYTQTGIPSTFGFEISLADRLSKAFPDETVYILKYAYGGCSLNYDFISPSSDVNVYVTNHEERERGWLYTGMVNSLESLINHINTTTNTIPSIEAFMWMQGESDAVFEGAANAYLSTFNNLVKDFKNSFKNYLSPKFAIYDAAISDSGYWEYSSIINQSKRSRVDEHNIYIETNDRLTTTYEPVNDLDKAHYDAASNIELGYLFADTYFTNNIRGFKPNNLVIENVDSINLYRGQNYVINNPKVYFNGVEVNAKITYFAEQYLNSSPLFSVNGNTLIPSSKSGNTNLRITAYYNNEIKTIVVPVRVI